MGGVGSRVLFWTWPALEAACARVCVCAFVAVVLLAVAAHLDMSTWETRLFGTT